MREIKGACLECYGAGRITCEACDGSGTDDECSRKPCAKCDGIGSVECEACGGSGERIIAYKRE